MAGGRDAERFEVLDGIRGISILLVLACHMLPLGPKSLQINTWAGSLGMSLFFPLSGFLITTTLMKHSDVVAFLIRRIFRIVPLAWLAAIIVFLIQGADIPSIWRTLLFVINYDEPLMVPGTVHFWSLCVAVSYTHLTLPTNREV